MKKQLFVVSMRYAATVDRLDGTFASSLIVDPDDIPFDEAVNYVAPVISMVLRHKAVEIVISNLDATLHGPVSQERINRGFYVNPDGKIGHIVKRDGRTTAAMVRNLDEVMWALIRGWPPYPKCVHGEPQEISGDCNFLQLLIAGWYGTWLDSRARVMAGDAATVRISARLPFCREWGALMDVVHGSDRRSHWRYMYSWCLNKEADWKVDPVRRFQVCGGREAFYYGHCHAEFRMAHVGFRPVFDVTGIDTLIPNGALVAAATLYMNGVPVKVPQNPTEDGDVQDYIPGARLEFRPALKDPAYMVQTIKVGDILIADRALLKNISWDDLQRQGFCS